MENSKNLSLGNTTYGEKGKHTFMKQLAKCSKRCLLNGGNFHLYLNFPFEGKDVLG